MRYTYMASEIEPNVSIICMSPCSLPQPVLRVYIPMADGGQRPLGIPTVRDRVAQQAGKMVIEPLFDANFQDSSYGFRPKRNAGQLPSP